MFSEALLPTIPPVPLIAEPTTYEFSIAQFVIVEPSAFAAIPPQIVPRMYESFIITFSIVEPLPIWANKPAGEPSLVYNPVMLCPCPSNEPVKLFMFAIGCHV